MALQDLLQKIANEANKKTAFMKQVTDDEIKKIEKETNEKAKISIKKIEQMAEEKITSVIKKAKTLANMEGRSQTLKEKRELIDQAYKEVLKKLDDMNSSDYVNFISKMLKFVSKDMPSGHLIISSGKHKETEEAIKKAGVQYHINNSESHDFKGGFVLTSGKIELNLSFPYLVQKIIRPATELDVAKTLFN